MIHAVTLSFDRPMNEILIDLWREIDTLVEGQPLINTNVRPHITLGLADGLDVEGFLPHWQSLASETIPFACSLSHIGCFTTGEQVVWLGPTVTGRLLFLHARIDALLGEHAKNLDEHFRPDLWVPHVTMAIGITATQALRVVERLQGLKLPLTGEITEINLVECEPPREKHRLPLGG